MERKKKCRHIAWHMVGIKIFFVWVTRWVNWLGSICDFLRYVKAFYDIVCFQWFKNKFYIHFMRGKFGRTGCKEISLTRGRSTTHVDVWVASKPSTYQVTPISERGKKYIN